MGRKNFIKLSTLKYNAIKLRKDFQIPFYLCYLITELSNDDSEEWLRFLMYESEHLLRVKGYYKRYPEEEESANKYLEGAFKNKNEIFKKGEN